MQNQTWIAKIQRFPTLFVAYPLGVVNASASIIALVLMLIRGNFAMHPYAALSLIAGICVIPQLVFSALFGQLVDKYRKDHLLQAAKFLEIIISAIVMLAIHTNNSFLLIIAVILFSLTFAMLNITSYSLLPSSYSSLIKINHSNLTLQAFGYAGLLVGIVLGISLSDIGGYILWVPIGLAVIGFLCCINLPHVEAPAPTLDILFNPVQVVKNTAQLFVMSRGVVLTALGISWFWLINIIVFGQLYYAIHQITHQVILLILLLTAFVCGIGVGVWIGHKLLKKGITTQYVPISVFIITIGLFDVAFSLKGLILVAHETSITNLLLLPISWRLVFDLFILACFGIFYNAPLITWLQTQADEQRGQIIAGGHFLRAVFVTVGLIIVLIFSAFDITPTDLIVFLAFINIVIAIYICKLLPQAVAQSFLKWLLTLFYKVRVHGLENYHAAGNRVLIIANHTSFLDVPLLSAFLPGKFMFAIDTLVADKWWLRPFLSLVDVFKVDPTKPMAIKPLIKAMLNKRKCIIFPEGRITVTGSLMKVYEGPGLIADRAKATLLPVRIDGVQHTPFSRMRGKVRFRWFPTITITVLPPQKFSLDDQVKGRRRREQTSLKLYDIMRTMLFASSNYHVTLFQSLLDAKQTQGGKRIILEDVTRKPLKYNQLILRSLILGHYINKTVAPKSAIGVLLPNVATTLVVFFAIQAYGRPAAMLNYTSGVKNIAGACQTGVIKTVYTSKAFIEAANLQPVVAKLTEIGVNVVCLEDLRSKISWLQKLRGMFVAKFADYYYNHATKISPIEPAVILFTSGSEGTPKGVVLSHENIQANRYQMTVSIPFTIKDSIFNALPVFHAFGLTVGTLLPIFSGIKTFLYPSPLHYRIVPELVYEMDATILFGTDTFLAGYARYAHPYDFYSVHYVFAGAEKVREKTHMLWAERFGLRILEGYGTTEAAPAVTGNTPMHNKRGTVGRLMPGLEYRLETVPGIPKGGRLWIKGPNIMMGYLLASQPGEIQPLEDGWYDTGDIVIVDQQGFITIQGRAKRFAKIGGEMVSLTAIEDYILELWPLHHHAVISVADARKGERIILVTDNMEATREDVVKFAKAKGVHELSIPSKIVTLKEIPLLGSGKVDYMAVKALFENTP